MRAPAQASLVALLLSAPAANAQDLPPEVREEVRAEVEEQLRKQLHADVKREVLEEAKKQAEASTPSPWDAERFKWEEPDRGGLDFLRFDGYFRFRYSLFHNLDLDTFVRDADGGPVGPYAPGGVPPVAICALDPACAPDVNSVETLAGANMRLRLEPSLEVYEDVRIRTQIDVLDRLVLGSTPDGFPKNDAVPLLAFSQSQLPSSAGLNALADSLAVKRAWAEVTTSLGQIRLGRMPSHFGMGLLTSSGSDLDSDVGDSVDRIMFATKLGGYYIMPAFEWGASGATSASRQDPWGQPFDRDQRDDVDRYVLIFAKGDTEGRELARAARGELAISYGAYAVYETQAIESKALEDPKLSSTTSSMVARDAELFMGSLWFRLLSEHFWVEAEAATMFGSLSSERATDFSPASVDVLSASAAARGELRLLGDNLALRLLVVAASGDRAPGFGVSTKDRGVAPQPGDFDGPQDRDGSITNFRVHPDFRVDRILWRRLIGTVTDALVIRPGVEYDLTSSFGIIFDAVYSRALFASSTPSAGFDPSADLGVELDWKLFYENKDFVAALEYGVLFPLSGLDVRVARGGVAETFEATASQTLEATLAVTF